MNKMTKILLGIAGLNTILSATNIVLHLKTKKRHEKYFGTLTKMYMDIENVVMNKED